MLGTTAIARLITGIGLGASLMTASMAAPTRAIEEAVGTGAQEMPVVVAPAETLEVSAIELQQLIYTVRAIERLGVGAAHADEIRRLGPSLAQLTIIDPEASRYTIPADRAESLRTVLEALTPEENVALNFVLLAGLPTSTNLQLSRQDIETFLAIARQDPPTDLTPKREKKIQTLAEDAGPTPESLLPAEESQILLNAVAAIYNLGDFPLPADGTAGREVSPEQLQDTLVFLSRLERSSNNLQQAGVSALLRDLSALNPNERGLFEISPEQDRQLVLLGTSLSGRRRRRLGRELWLAEGGRLISPSVSILTPIGFGSYFGNIAFGGTYQNETRFSDGSEDGSLATTIGLGDPVNAIGFDVTLAIFSVTNQNNSDAFENGSLSFQISRNLAPNISLGLGVENLVTWQAGSNDSGTNTYFVASSFWPLREDPEKPFGRIFVSGGAGNGRFRRPRDFDFVDDGGIGDFRPFGGIALQLVSGVSAIVEWTGQDLSAGLSAVPFRRVPLVFTVAGIDLTGNVEKEFGFDGDPRFTASASYIIFF